MIRGVTRRISGDEQHLALYFDKVKERLAGLQKSRNYAPQPIVLNLAGKRVGVVFGSQANEDALMPSLASQRAPGQTPDAGCLYFWQDWPGNYCPAIEQDDFDEEVWRHESAAAKIFVPIKKVYYLAWHYARNEFFYCLPATHCQNFIHTTHPLRPQLHAWALQHDLLFAHGAAVEVAGCGIFIGAASGSGKSTLATSCLLAGHKFAGDDYVLIDRGNVAHMVCATANLHLDMLERMPALRRKVIGKDARCDNKTLLDLSDYAQALKQHIKLRMVLIPRLSTNEGPAIRQVSPARPLWEVVRSTAEQNGVPHSRIFINKVFTQLTSLPVYEFLLSPDVNCNVEALETFVKKRKAYVLSE